MIKWNITITEWYIEWYNGMIEFYNCMMVYLNCILAYYANMPLWNSNMSLCNCIDILCEHSIMQFKHAMMQLWYSTHIVLEVTCFLCSSHLNERKQFCLVTRDKVESKYETWFLFSQHYLFDVRCQTYKCSLLLVFDQLSLRKWFIRKCASEAEKWSNWRATTLQT